MTRKSHNLPKNLPGFGLEGDPLLSNQQWQGISVDSRLFSKLEFEKKLFQLALSYLESAIALSEKAGLANEKISWAQASVCYYCLNIATELFLKSFIAKNGKNVQRYSHDIPKLWKDYREFFPEEDYNWPCAWNISLETLNEMLGCEIMVEIDRKPSEFHRYGADKKGFSGKTTYLFTPGDRYPLF